MPENVIKFARMKNVMNPNNVILVINCQSHAMLNTKKKKSKTSDTIFMFGNINSMIYVEFVVFFKLKC